MLKLYCSVVLYIVRERMLAHIQQMDANLKLSSQQLNETIRDYQMTVQDLETTVQR